MASTLLLLLMAVSAPVLVAGHNCIHDTVQSQVDIVRDPEDSQSRPHFAALQARAPIRFALDLSRLQPAADSQTTYCASGSTTCTGLSPEKAAYITNVLLPKATAWLRDAFSVVPLTANIVQTVDCYQVTAASMSATIKTTGLAGDYLLFVTARPTSAGVLAWAAYCRTQANGRPYVAQINFGPDSLDMTAAALDGQVSVAIHELTHALGFSSSAYSTYRTPAGTLRTGVTKSVTVNGVVRTGITLPTVVAKMKEHYGCTSAAVDYMPLEEFGGAGTAGSHWEARVVNHEYMAGRISRAPAYGAITLALFEDSGWYGVNYTTASGFAWGKNAGCAFLTDRCNTWTAENHFCPGPDNKVRGCTFDGQIGYCGIATYTTAISPNTFQYFSNAALGGTDQMMDFCPVLTAYTDGSCTVPGNAGTQSVSLFGEYYGTQYPTTCFMNNIFPEGYTADAGTPGPRCYRYECRGTAAAPELWVNVASGGTASWMQCQTPGQQLTGFTNIIAGRYLKCPSDLTKLCPVTAGASATPAASRTPTPTATATATPATSRTPTPAPGSLCPGACSGNGVCSGGVCSCSTGWIGIDCATTAPTSYPALAVGVTVSGTTQLGQYTDYSIDTTMLNEMLVLNATVADPVGTDVEIIVAYLPAVPTATSGFVWKTVPGPLNSLAIRSDDPKYRAGSMIVRMFAAAGAPSWTLRATRVSTVPAGAVQPCPYGCSGVGTCVQNQTYAACTNCPAKRRGRGCQIDDTATTDVVPTNRMLSTTGDKVNVKVVGGAYTYLYLEIRTPADITVVASPPAGMPAFTLLASAARDEHPVLGSSIWSSTASSGATPTSVAVLASDPFYPSTGLYVGIYVDAPSTETYDPVMVTFIMSNVRDLAALKLCVNDCAGSGTCVNGKCTSKSSTSSSRTPFTSSPGGKAAIIAPIAIICIIAVAVLALVKRGGSKPAAAYQNQT